MFLSLYYPSKITLRQILLAMIGFVEGSCAGGIFAFTSILFEQLKQNPAIVLSADDESWIASIVTMFMVPSCLFSGVVAETTGRRLQIIISKFIALFSWLITYLANDYNMLVAARSLFGIYLGMAYPTFITYLGEVATPQYRTLLLTAIPFGTTFGFFICQFLGVYLHWTDVAMFFSILSVYNFLTLLHVKESYVTYFNRNNCVAAQISFEWFRGTGNAAQEEFIDFFEKNKKRSKTTFMELAQHCKKKLFLIPLGITILVFLTNEVTGTQAIIFYTSHIISMITKDAEFSYYATLCLNLLRIVAVILSVLFVKLSSVRFILIVSGYLLGSSLVILALFLYLSLTYSGIAIYPILSFVFLGLCTVLYGIGLGPLSSVVCGEMFPQETRSIGTSISVAASFLFLFLTVKFMPLMFANFGPDYTFGIFGLFTLTGIAASQCCLPNTQNKTLSEINRLYQEEN